VAKPSDEIRALYVLRLERQGIGDLDDASHETCMLARWDGLLEWLDDQQESARVERKLTDGSVPSLTVADLISGLDRPQLATVHRLAPSAQPKMASSDPVRVLGTEQTKRARRSCERDLVGKEVKLNGRKWVVRVVDHLDSTANLVEAFGDFSALKLNSVPLVDVATAVGAGCSCGQHVDGGDRV